MGAHYQTAMLMNSSMKFSTAFREAMFRYELRGSDLSKRSGVSNAQISKFKSGQNINVTTMEKLLAAMPQEAREYMLTLVAQSE
jgi:predicted transcriptional regulator